MINPYNYARPKRPAAIPPKGNPARQSSVATRKAAYGKTDNYLEQKVMAAKPEELTLMLYEGAIKFLKKAKLFNDQKEITKSHESNLRAQAIVEELRATLDMNVKISEEFERLYIYMNERLVEANINKDNTILDEVIGLLGEFRDAWKQAMKL